MSDRVSECVSEYQSVSNRFPRQFREFRPSPDPELTGSVWICRGQRVVLKMLVLLLLVVVLLLVA